MSPDYDSFMRNRKELDSVNVAARRQMASDRVGSAIALSDITHFPQPARKRHFNVLDLLKGESVVTTHTNDGSPAVIKVPHSLLAVMVTIALACIGAGFWIVSSVTEMKTNLATIQRNQTADKATYSGNLRLMIAYTTNETNRVEFMKGLLTQSQQRQVFEWEKSNPKPPLPSTDMEDPKD